MLEQFSRTALLIGEESVSKLNGCTVAVFGLGGVGSFAAEALARSGVGGFLLVDHDTVDITNINRQLHATLETVGRQKAGLMGERILSINRTARIDARAEFCTPENAGTLLAGEFDYIIDAVDTVSAKLAIIEEAARRGVPVISAMGAGNKLDPARFKVAGISETSVCPLCRVMRRELKKRGITTLKVVYSDEPPIRTAYPQSGEARASGRPVPGSIAFVPPVMGLIIASEVVRQLVAGHKGPGS